MRIEDIEPVWYEVKVILRSGAYLHFFLSARNWICLPTAGAITMEMMQPDEHGGTALECFSPITGYPKTVSWDDDDVSAIEIEVARETREDLFNENA